MKAPRFSRQIEIYSQAIADLKPHDERVAELVPRATRFALHELLAGRDEGMLDFIAERFSGTLALAQTLDGADIIPIGRYRLHIGAMPFAHASFVTSPHVVFSLDHSGQPLFDLHEPTPGTIAREIA